MTDSDSDSALSSAPPTEDEMPVETAPAKAPKAAPQKKKKNGTILTFFNKRSPSPPARQRPASPPHEYVPEDNPDIAFIVMFRSRFNEAFPRNAPHVGPQDIELGVAEGAPSPDVEGLLCALLGLVLNRKKPVEKGHYGRALEEAIQTQKSQWPAKWNYINPLSGSRSFNTMTPTERIILLHTLCLWSLNQSEEVKAMIAQAYKSRTTKDKLDTNIPLSVQPWGRDGEKRRYWLVEGQNDTHFRVYREGKSQTAKATWWSVAGSIDELRVLAKVLEEEDGHREAKMLSERMINAVPRFEASEVKRKRREYRVNRTAAFTRPEPGFSLYEGRTRGKRQRYTYDEGDDFDSDDAPVRRSSRQSARDSSPMHSGPTVTASGRQVRSRAAGTYGETLHSGQTTDRASPATGEYVRSDVSEEPRQSRSTRAGNRSHLNREMDSEEDDDATSWDGGEEEEEPDQMDLDDGDEDDLADQSSDEEQEPQTLLVTLHYRKQPSNISDETNSEPASTNGAKHNADIPMSDVGAPLQPAAPAIAVALPPTQPAPQPPCVIPTAIPNSLSVQQPTVIAAPKVEQQQPPAEANALPKLDGFFSAPTPPYIAPEEAPKQEQPPFHPVQPEAPQQLPYSTTLPVTTHAPNWQ
ncbi:hypothetical protein BU25DRAFT_493900 [Macroventuria anomochaeta]|uniref:Uncharacterized protein n=1 Tax=Macroventuria anomochaeta TaxID=301207 RepID=A0ACB6RRU5_9PLEO|nr:uncharacterized protein BU25DRAFT_493900 [Macroventuria anomochaeta]KAF2623997.1 hypothetical protein BU25DRAFT_493900 [Macroventuria anomochaeta]